MKQRILVLGAGGFIGSRVLHALTQSSWAEPIAGRRSGTSIGNAESLRVDACNATSLATALSQCDAVVNCVAGSAESIIANAKALKDSLGADARSPRLVHLSSLAAYGSARGDVDEDAPLLGDLDSYSHAKAEAERILGAYPNRVILRPGIVYGPKSIWWSDRIARLLMARRLGNLGSNGNGICNLVYVDDVATAVVNALQSSSSSGKAFNLSLPDSPTWNGYFTAYATALNALPVRRISPSRLTVELKIKAPVLKVAEIASRAGPFKAWHPAPPIRPWLTTLCRHEIRMRVSRAETQLGMRWLPLTSGLQQAAEWFLAGGRV